MIRTVIVAITIAAANSTTAKSFSLCYSEPGTNKAFCIDEADVTVNGDTRSSALWTGGPKGVDKTPYRIVTNCKKEISTLQDSKGVNFAGGVNGQTPAIRDLSSMLCGAKPTRKDPSLRQF
jgi:hypothetical protein